MTFVASTLVIVSMLGLEKQQHLPVAQPAPVVTVAAPLVVFTSEPKSELAARQPKAAPTSPAPEPGIDLNALTWVSEPRVPVILYHRFIPDTANPSPTRMRLAEFHRHLEVLYANGYSLVSLEKWLAGDMTLPVGRHPLILTIDDLFFADQIFLDPDGRPSLDSGLGVLWQFSQEHPDFGFSAALFFNMGDKHYANYQTQTWFVEVEGWEDALAKVIVWCIEHDALPYNHFFTHPRLDWTESEFVECELYDNDLVLRSYLQRAGRPDLIGRLKNFVALPYSIWPPAEGGKQALLNYRNPEGEVVQVVLEAGYYHDDKTLPAPYFAGFDRYHIPRITTNTNLSLEYLIDQRPRFPAAQECNLAGLDPQNIGQAGYLGEQIGKAVREGRCQPGYYWVGGFFFDAMQEDVHRLDLVWP